MWAGTYMKQCDLKIYCNGTASEALRLSVQIQRFRCVKSQKQPLLPKFSSFFFQADFVGDFRLSKARLFAWRTAPLRRIETSTRTTVGAEPSTRCAFFSYISFSEYSNGTPRRKISVIEELVEGSAEEESLCSFRVLDRMQNKLSFCISRIASKTCFNRNRFPRDAHSGHTMNRSHDLMINRWIRTSKK